MIRRFYRNEYHITYDKTQKRYELWKKVQGKIYFKFERYMNNKEEVNEFIKTLTTKDKYTMSRSSNL